MSVRTAEMARLLVLAFLAHPSLTNTSHPSRRPACIQPKKTWNSKKRVGVALSVPPCHRVLAIDCVRPNTKRRGRWCVGAGRNALGIRSTMRYAYSFRTSDLLVSRNINRKRTRTSSSEPTRRGEQVALHPPWQCIIAAAMPSTTNFPSAPAHSAIATSQACRTPFSYQENGSRTCPSTTQSQVWPESIESADLGFPLTGPCERGRNAHLQIRLITNSGSGRYCYLLVDYAWPCHAASYCTWVEGPFQEYI